MKDRVYLEPVYDSRQSFYKKAYVTREGDLEKLTSYSTVVASYNVVTKEAIIYGFYSDTTTRHIKDFLYQRGVFRGNVTKQFLFENFTKTGQKIAKEKAAKRESLEREREEKRALKEMNKKAREIRKENLLKELTAELGGSFSKSEIRKILYKELESEFGY